MKKTMELIEAFGITSIYVSITMFVIGTIFSYVYLYYGVCAAVARIVIKVAMVSAILAFVMYLVYNVIKNLAHKHFDRIFDDEISKKKEE